MAKKPSKLLVIPDHIRKAMASREREEFEVRTVPLAWQLFVESFIKNEDHGLELKDYEREMLECMEIGYLWTQVSEAWMDRKREEKDGPSEDLKKIKVD